ncbi:hypothetical protein H0A61_00985 [Koleobacter methoxysyntrophicus]|uniref:DUF4446 domain-containing protein n=1 Tax=Koleobacter methoxysyntrophicus TaxID=2751313 RepID=A0A8A0RMG3_9FIRM|nr:DUF4446 family protein [Koleobacter methoxysyntrophicus]QSQ08647.1 hypothetical protein H0A61_00985 [Koleobacter methoxysyntrophicus]
MNLQSFVDNFSAFINQYIAEALLISLLLLVVSFLVLLILILKMRRVTRIYRQLITGSEGVNLEGLLVENMKIVYTALNRIKDMEETFRDFEARLDNCLQKVGIVRYNAFKDVGGELSFAIALLDSNNNGLVLNSVYGRQENRTYAKPIVNGRCSYQLSVEEREAVDIALKSRY